MKLRKPKKTDQADAEKAFQLLLSLIGNHQKEIEPALWVGPMICALSENYEKSDIPFEYFKKEITEAIEYYRY